MSKALIIKTKAGGTVTIAHMPGDYNFIASMKAARSDGAIFTDHLIVPWDAIDSVMVTTPEMLQQPDHDTKVN